MWFFFLVFHASVLFKFHGPFFNGFEVIFCCIFHTSPIFLGFPHFSPETGTKGWEARDRPSSVFFIFSCLRDCLFIVFRVAFFYVFRLRGGSIQMGKTLTAFFWRTKSLSLYIYIHIYIYIMYASVCKYKYICIYTNI